MSQVRNNWFAPYRPRLWLLGAMFWLGFGAGMSRCSAQNFAAGVTNGMVTAFEISEASGIIASRQNPGVLWTHNDSGYAGNVFALSTNGALLARYYVPGVFSGNFEDIAFGPGPTPEHQYIYLADIGDNFTNRTSVRVFRFPEPAVYAYQSNNPPVLPVPTWQEIQFSYPDRPYDAEALMVDPRTGDMFISTKETNSARIYMATRAELDGGGPIQLTFVREMNFNGFRSVAAGDISADGGLIAMRRNGRAWVWNRQSTQTISNALAVSGSTQPVANDVNGEAIGFHPTGLGYYTISEGFGPPINFFRRTDTGVPRQPVVFIKPGEDWRYQDLGVDEGAAWREILFNDSDWASGPAQLGYGQGDEGTVVSYGFDDFDKFTTTYFRRQFTRTATPVVTNLALRVCFTDGIAVYLNGNEVLRRNLDAGAAFDRRANASNSGRQNYWLSIPVNPALLRVGINTVAVELHRLEAWQPDLSFDLQLSEGAVELPARFTTRPQLTGGNWRIGVAGPVGSLVTIEASNDLQEWEPAGQLVMTAGVSIFSESAASTGAYRFYRLRN